MRKTRTLAARLLFLATFSWWMRYRLSTLQ